MNRDLRRAYGAAAPGTGARYERQRAEREAAQQSRRQRAAWALYRRVHGEPSPHEREHAAHEVEVRRALTRAMLS